MRDFIDFHYKLGKIKLKDIDHKLLILYRYDCIYCLKNV